MPRIKESTKGEAMTITTANQSSDAADRANQIRSHQERLADEMLEALPQFLDQELEAYQRRESIR